MEIKSSFADGGTIARRHGYKQDNKSPEITISGIPKSAASVALIMDDPDAIKPAGKIWVHWLAWGIKPDSDGSCHIPEGKRAPREGLTDFGSTGYGGPAPPDGMHTYIFKAYALDVILDIPAGATKKQLEAAMKGHILETATLRGTFAP